VSASFALAWAVRGVRQEIVNALSSAESEADKAEIERKVLKAVYPPRFHR